MNLLILSLKPEGRDLDIFSCSSWNEPPLRPAASILELKLFTAGPDSVLQQDLSYILLNMKGFHHEKFFIRLLYPRFSLLTPILSFVA